MPRYPLASRSPGEDAARAPRVARTDGLRGEQRARLQDEVAGLDANDRGERIPGDAAGVAPGGTHANHRFLADWVEYDADISKEDQLVLCDAQTSGGLLAAVAADQADAVLDALNSAGVANATIIGMIESGTPSRIHVTRSRSAYNDSPPKPSDR